MLHLAMIVLGTLVIIWALLGFVRTLWSGRRGPENSSTPSEWGSSFGGDSNADPFGHHGGHDGGHGDAGGGDGGGHG